MPYYLVEEHTTGPYCTVGEENIPYHVLVHGKDERQAFRAAEQQSMKTRRRRYHGSFPVEEEPASFLFLDSELSECIPGYLWQAADGSDIWYEVRRIGTVTQLTTQPAEKEEDETMPSPDPAPRRGVGLAQQAQVLHRGSKGEVHGRTS